MSNSQKLYLADTAVGQRYDVCRATPWRWAKEGKFPQPVRLSPGCTRWLLADLEEWEKAQRDGDKS